MAGPGMTSPGTTCGFPKKCRFESAVSEALSRVKMISCRIGGVTHVQNGENLVGLVAAPSDMFRLDVWSFR
jgi:hypothetical protein